MYEEFLNPMKLSAGEILHAVGWFRDHAIKNT